MADSDGTLKKRDPVAAIILEMLADAGPGGTISPNDVARSIATLKHKAGDPPDAWRRYMNAVNQQALHLARQGEISILRKGVAVDPNTPFRGLVKLTLPNNQDNVRSG